MRRDSVVLLAVSVGILPLLSGCSMPCSDNLCYRAGGATWTATYEERMNKTRVVSTFEALGFDVNFEGPYQVGADNDSVWLEAKIDWGRDPTDPPLWTLEGSFGDGQYFLSESAARRHASHALEWSGSWFNRTVADFEAAYGSEHVSVEWQAPVHEP